MPRERRRRIDLDERFSLTGDPEEVLRRLLAVPVPVEEEEPVEDEEGS